MEDRRGHENLVIGGRCEECFHPLDRHGEASTATVRCARRSCGLTFHSSCWRGACRYCGETAEPIPVVDAELHAPTSDAGGDGPFVDDALEEPSTDDATTRHPALRAFVILAGAAALYAVVPIATSRVSDESARTEGVGDTVDAFNSSTLDVVDDPLRPPTQPAAHPPASPVATSEGDLVPALEKPPPIAMPSQTAPSVTHLADEIAPPNDTAPAASKQVELPAAVTSAEGEVDRPPIDEAVLDAARKARDEIEALQRMMELERNVTLLTGRSRREPDREMAIAEWEDAVHAAKELAELGGARERALCATTHASFARSLVADAEVALRERAFELALDASRWNTGEDPRVVAVLAAAQAATQRWPDSVRSIDRALELTDHPNSEITSVEVRVWCRWREAFTARRLPEPFLD